jgi:hypothetical protein
LAYETGIIEIADDHKVYYRYKEAQNGAKTLVLLNGLIYAIENWDEYVQELADSDVVGVCNSLTARSLSPSELLKVSLLFILSGLQFNPLSMVQARFSKGLKLKTSLMKLWLWSTPLKSTDSIWCLCLMAQSWLQCLPLSRLIAFKQRSSWLQLW